MRSLDPEDLGRPAAQWAKREIERVSRESIEIALGESEVSKDSDGSAAVRAIESLKVRIAKYEQFLIAHRENADGMEPQAWADKLIQEGISFWGQVTGAAEWGEHFFCKMVGLSCTVKGDSDGGHGSEDGE